MKQSKRKRRLATDDGTLMSRANSIATAAHLGQKRILTGVPFIIHPRAVRTLLKDYGFGLVEQAAGLLHDCIEDCPKKWRIVRLRKKLQHVLAGEVIEIVQAITYDPVHDLSASASHTSRQAYLRSAYCRRIMAHPRAASVSLADKIHNLLDVIELLGKGVPVYGRNLLNRDPAEEVRYIQSYLLMMRRLAETDRAIIPLLTLFEEKVSLWQQLLKL